MRRVPFTAGFLLEIELAIVLSWLFEVDGTHEIPIHASYTKDQADRGKAQYAQNSRKCHTQNLKGNCQAEELSGWRYVCSATGIAPPLVGSSFLRRWHSVADLYLKIKATQPALYIAGLSTSEYFDIVA